MRIDRNKRKKSILSIFLTPLVWVVLLQGAILFLTVLLSGVEKDMQENSIHSFSHMVENRRLELENDMLEQCDIINQECAAVTAQLAGVLAERQLSIGQFQEDDAAQKQLLTQVKPELTDLLQHNIATGSFLILTNEADISQEADYHGLLLRETDSADRRAFRFMGQGCRAADAFFYEPYAAGLACEGEPMQNLGYWAKPFVPETGIADGQAVITYSVPLQYEGKIYGIWGVEISVERLEEYFEVSELDERGHAGYAILLDKGEGKYEAILGKGELQDAVAQNDRCLTMNRSGEIYRIQDRQVGKQDIYAILKPLKLYDGEVPYADTSWVVCGFVMENSIYQVGRSLYRRLLLALFITVAGVILCVYRITRKVTEPVYRLVDSVREGVDAIHAYQRSGILEIDELHSVVKHLTTAQKKSELLLIEEKERYRVAVESSRDTYFTFRKKEATLELVNSRGRDGIWDCRANPEFLDNACIHPEDKEMLFARIRQATEKINIDFRLRATEQDPYLWMNLSGKIVYEASGEVERINGCLHNIHTRKLLEEAQKRKQYYDAATGFYRLSYGKEALAKACGNYPHGVLVMLSIDRYASINEQYGMIYGDLMLEQLARQIVQTCEESRCKNACYIRAAAAELMLWLPDLDVEMARTLMEQIAEKFAALAHEQALILSFRCGATEVTESLPVDTYLKQVGNAMFITKAKVRRWSVYQQLHAEERGIYVDIPLVEADSFDRIRQMRISALALAMFDRGGNTTAILDMLACKLCEAYGLENLVITDFNTEYLSNSRVYSWRKPDRQEQEVIIHCTQSQYTRSVEAMHMQEIEDMTQETFANRLLQGIVDGGQGLIYHMKDNGHYAGSILFLGIGEKAVRDETDRKQLQEMCTIIQNKLNLQRYDLSARAKSAFLARMSHEIRTPMNGIIGMTQIALQEGQTEQQRLVCLGKIQHASGYLLGLLNDILDMSKIESGKMRLVYQEEDMRQTIHEVGELIEGKLLEKEIAYQTEIRLVHTRFSYDALRLKQILLNLLSNAVKYSQTGKTVRLLVEERAADRGEAQVYFAVQDEGVGIAKDKQLLIFRQFEQADESETARTQGTGLGLAICSRLVRMMDAEIEVESAVNRGSTFSFCLTLRIAGEAADTKDRPARTSMLQGKRVLVAEDNALNTEIICTYLETYGIRTDTVENGKEAVEAVQNAAEGYYDLVLMDVMMPVMDGMEAAAAIRRLDRTDCKRLPIIAMSANAFEEDVKRSFESGMNGHVSKPIRMDRLEEVLTDVLGTEDKEGYTK